jgi:hypothetical protein
MGEDVVIKPGSERDSWEGKIGYKARSVNGSFLVTFAFF